MAKVLVIDNADSFTFNLVDLIERIGHESKTVRNTITPTEVLAWNPKAMVLSPGPSSPEFAGHLIDICQQCAPKIPTLGVCLGLQAMVLAFGGKLGKLEIPVQGYASQVEHDGSGAFRSVPSPVLLGRYHALYAKEVPVSFEVTARSVGKALNQCQNVGVVMGIRHKTKPIEGFQFHPESILSMPYGEMILKQWFEEVGAK